MVQDVDYYQHCIDKTLFFMIGQKLASFIVMVPNILVIERTQLTTRIKIYILEEAEI